MSRSSSADLARLLPALEAAFEAERRQMTVLGAKINHLRKLLDQTRVQVSGEDLALFTSGADIRWAAWAGARRRELNQQIAQLMADREVVRARLTRAFGRKQALDRLLADARAYEARQRAAST